MQFNPDLNKQAQGITFSIKTMKPVHSAVQFNDSAKADDNIQKQLGLFLDQNLSFIHHMKKKLGKVMKGVTLIKKLSNAIPRLSLITVHKSFVRPPLDYGDIVYDEPNNDFAKTLKVCNMMLPLL